MAGNVVVRVMSDQDLAAELQEIADRWPLEYAELYRVVSTGDYDCHVSCWLDKFVGWPDNDLRRDLEHAESRLWLAGIREGEQH